MQSIRSSTNKRKLAEKALRYLNSLNEPLPDETDKKWYEQNASDYQALLKLNTAGLGTTVDELILVEYEKRDVIDKSPNIGTVFTVAMKSHQLKDVSSY